MHAWSNFDILQVLDIVKTELLEAYGGLFDGCKILIPLLHIHITVSIDGVVAVDSRNAVLLNDLLFT